MLAKPQSPLRASADPSPSSSSSSCPPLSEGKPLSTLGRHHWWDAYILVKHVSELAILVLMLYKLQGRKTSRVNHAHHHGQYSHAHSAGGSGAKEIKPNKREYTEVKDVSLEEGHGTHKAANGQAPH